MESHSNQEGSQQKKRKRVTKNGKSSPCKLKKGRSQTKSPKVKTVTTFMEDDNEVQFEVADFDLETIFPTQQEQRNKEGNESSQISSKLEMKSNKKDRRKSEPTTSNNNATPISQSTEGLEEREESDSDEDREEGEAETDYDSEDSEESVQISEKTKKYFEEQRRLEEERNQQLIDKTMDKTFEKLTAFMQQTGMVNLETVGVSATQKFDQTRRDSSDGERR